MARCGEPLPPEVAGPVDAAVAAHHGLFDSTGADVVRALRPRVWLIDIWHVSHPSITTLERLFSQRPYSGPRDVFKPIGLSPANSLVNERLTRRVSAPPRGMSLSGSLRGEAVIASSLRTTRTNPDRVRPCLDPAKATRARPLEWASR